MRTQLVMSQRESRIKDDFTNRLEKSSESSVEFSFTIGNHLESLLYLDNNWVISNINLIFPQEEEQYWEAAMKGYLYKTASAPQVLYEILRDNGNYSKAIQYSFDKREIREIREITENLVSHICYKYLAKKESLENSSSLISQLLNYKNIPQFLILIHFIWMRRNDSVEDYKNLVYDLWGKLYEILLKEEKNPDYHVVIQHLFKWLEIFDELDESLVEWLKLSRCIKSVYLRQFVKDLQKYASKSPEWVSEIFLESLNFGNTLCHKEEDIRDLVDILFEYGGKENANKICFHYGSKGLHFLQDIYEKYN